MFEILNKYSHNGHFEFTVEDNLRVVCNAPTDKSGVYIVWTNMDGKEQLLYIGRSGKKENGVIVHRKCGLGGIKDRLVNGHQFGKLPRRRIWPEKMKEMGLSVLSIDWYDTEEDDPVEVERLLLAEATYKMGVLPPWNNQMY